MNPPGSIEGNFLQGTGKEGFEFFKYLIGMLYFSNKSLPWHGAEISENPGCNSHFKNSGRENFLKLKKKGAKL